MTTVLRIATTGSSTEPSLSLERGAVHRRRIGDRSAAADELGAVGLVRRRADRRCRGPSSGASSTAAARRPSAGRRVHRIACRGADELGLDEQVAERGVRRVGGRRRQHHLGEARQLDRARRPAAVGDADPAQLDVVLGRDADLDVRVDVAIAAAELGAALREDRLVAAWPA